MSEDLFREMVQASVVLDGLPEYGGYNGSAFVIDDIERDRIVAAIDKVITLHTKQWDKLPVFVW